VIGLSFERLVVVGLKVLGSCRLFVDYNIQYIVVVAIYSFIKDSGGGILSRLKPIIT
jgi:hypothetical protein